ncbi:MULTISPECIES: hypothetical protein [Gemmobacter]|uniref:WD40 repeat protein n=2 Tax=Gemmobacter TaxID=204456 RepID=A0A2T6B528_9RHOB|nr:MULTISPECIES: hypothetical protein [Gemmobacter]PTX51186.1 hypothetical protein C8N34_104306 [Gemmobacter caeni]TWJ01186.1 hypothetical protein IQ03_01903 [Gemmobacter caeni]GHC17724.1 hypothetical protein GCM10007291_15350 [Gemmobacter nanjingensis]
MTWRSSLEVCDPQTGDCRVILRSDRLIEAPNWHPEGWFLVNGDGGLWRASATGLEQIVTPGGLRCNNDHGFLPDGSIVFTAHTDEGPGIYRLSGGGVQQIVERRPSWWHGAHARRVACAVARGDRVLRIAETDLDSGTERVLTEGPGTQDGPDYSACGRHIWFNSTATGHAQIWRMAADGRDAVPVFRDDRVNWFPHPSPCGRHVVYLSYPPGTGGHPRDLDVSLWIMRPDGSDRRRLVDLFGGQGSLNVPCWAPDGHAFAFMRYAPASGGAGT